MCAGVYIRVAGRPSDETPAAPAPLGRVAGVFASVRVGGDTAGAGGGDEPRAPPLAAMADDDAHHVVRRRREVNWLYATPLFLVVIPLIRIAFRRQPALGRKLTFGAIGVGLVHGAWLIARSQPDGTEEEGLQPPAAAAGRAAAAAAPLR